MDELTTETVLAEVVGIIPIATSALSRSASNNDR